MKLIDDRKRFGFIARKNKFVRACFTILQI